MGELEGLTASAEDLPAGSAATAEITDVGGHKNIAIGIPAGQQGDPGEPGEPGNDGFSPVVSVSDITGGHRVSITDATGTKTFDVMNGTDGQDGDPGEDGFSPIVTITDITGGNQVTITDAEGNRTFDVMDGATADDIIDDSAGTGVTNKTWSADKLATEFDSTLSALNDKYEKPASGIPASDLASGVIPTVPVTDVQVNGTSVLLNVVANIPVASDTTIGAVKVAFGSQGLYVHSTTNQLIISKASDNEVKAGTNTMKPIVPSNQKNASFYGLAAAAGDSTQSSSSNAVGVYTADALVKIQKMLGIYEAPWELIREDTVTNATEADIEITVDGNGQAFQLTDVVLLFETPKQDTASGKGAYGDIRFYYDGDNYLRTYCSAWTQNANADAKGTQTVIRNENGMIFVDFVQVSTTGSGGNNRTYYQNNFTGTMQGCQYISGFAVYKINIKAVTGTGHYKLYGKRKWT